jgi:hypothetical protein
MAWERPVGPCAPRGGGFASTYDRAPPEATSEGAEAARYKALKIWKGKWTRMAHSLSLCIAPGV